MTFSYELKHTGLLAAIFDVLPVDQVLAVTTSSAQLYQLSLLGSDLLKGDELAQDNLRAQPPRGSLLLSALYV